MSRRPNPAADRAEQNRATLKSLVKLESNKSCADCKRNKHPRWASWNLGIFICIRCSGIHRGMGTHISRVKSVDLDSWTDEQLQSMLRWGNSRSNKYWESKLAPGHVPAEAKIENFIRTKYESKRWVMDGPMPDPATLDAEGDDEVPLNVVQEKAKLERSSSQRIASGPAPATVNRPPPRQQQQNIDLFGDDPEPAPRPSTTGPSIGRSVPLKAEAAPPKQTRPGDSLLGLDFFGAPSAPPARPSSTTGTPASSAGASRPDLKQSILSLYAAKPAAPPQPVQQSQTDAFGGLGSPNPSSPQATSSGFGGMNDAFSGLSFNSRPAQQQPPPKSSAFADLAGFSSAKPTPPSAATTSTFGGGGSFFDSLPKSPKQNDPPMQQAKPLSPTGGFGSFSSPSVAAAHSQPAASSGMGDLFDLSMPAAQSSMPASKPAAPTSPPLNSVFNLSSPPATKPAAPAQPKASAAVPNYSTGFNNDDPWGSSNAWASSTSSTTQPAASTTAHDNFGGWASSTTQKTTSPPKVSTDEDFGGWSSAPTQTSTTTAPKPLSGGLGGGDDLFSNVWE